MPLGKYLRLINFFTYVSMMMQCNFNVKLDVMIYNDVLFTILTDGPHDVQKDFMISRLHRNKC